MVERAPEPDDILWQNADKSRSTILRNKVISYLICIAILILGGYVQYVLQIEKGKIVN